VWHLCDNCDTCIFKLIVRVMVTWHWPGCIAKSGVNALAPRPYSFGGSAEHSALGQDAYMGMTFNLPPLHGRSRQQGGGRRCLQDSLRGDHLRRGPLILGGPIEAREQASENDSISRQSEQPSRDAGADTSTNKICRSAPRAVVIRLAGR